MSSIRYSVTNDKPLLNTEYRTVNTWEEKMLPFQALVGLEVAQQALLLLAVEPRLRGVVLAAGEGTVE